MIRYYAGLIGLILLLLVGLLAHGETIEDLDGTWWNERSHQEKQLLVTGFMLGKRAVARAIESRYETRYQWEFADDVESIAETVVKVDWIYLHAELLDVPLQVAIFFRDEIIVMLGE